jgi:CheY-like chemotaxis protein
MPLAVLLADDHDFIRRSIKSLLETDPEIRVVAEASNFSEAMQRTAEFKPDVIVLDLHMGTNEFDASEIRAAFAGRRLIAITAWNDEESGVLAGLRSRRIFRQAESGARFNTGHQRPRTYSLAEREKMVSDLARPLKRRALDYVSLGSISNRSDS